MASRIKGITVEIDGDTTKLSKALEGVNKTIRGTQTQLKDVQKLLKLDPSNAELLNQKQKLLSQSIDATRQKLAQLKSVQEQMDEGLRNGTVTQEQYDAWQREIVATEQELRNLETEAKNTDSSISATLRAAGERVTAIGTSFQKVGDSIAGFGSKLTMGVAMPLVAVGTAGTKSFAEVDKTMQLTNKTMGSTAQEAESLNTAMKDAAANSVYGMSDAATATLNFARAGLDASQAADALAPAMNLAAGEGGDLDTVSAGLVATINGFHGAFSEAGKYADVFAAACNNSALDVNSLSQAMSVAAPIFSSAGYAVEDAALYMGVMANNGIEADKAANSLKTGIARLVSPAKDGAEKMAQLGISVTNADGSMKDSVTVQKELHEAFGKLSESEQIAAASAIFGKNQMAPWLALINTAPSDVNELNTSLSNCSGTTQEMADTMMGGFGGSLEKLKSSVDVLVYSLGQALALIIQTVVDKIQGLVDKFNALSPQEQQAIVKFGALAAAAGPVLTVVGKLTSGVGMFMTRLGGLISKLGMISGPAAALVAVIGTLIAAFVHLWQTNETFRSDLTAIWESLKAKFQEFAQSILERVNALGFNFTSFTELLKAAWDGLCSYLAPIFTTAFQTIADFLGNTLNTILSVIDVFIAVFQGDWSGAWEAVKSVFESIWTNLTAFIQNGLNFICNIFGTDLESVKTFWVNIWQSVSDFFVSIWNGLQNFLINIFTAIGNFFTNTWTNIKNFCVNTWNSIRDSVSNIVNAIKSTVTSVWESLTSDVTNTMATLKTNTVNAWTNLKTSVTNTVNTIKNTVTTVFTNIWNGIKSTMSQIASSVKEGFQSAVDYITSLPSKALQWGKDIINGIVNGIKSCIGKVGEAASSVAEKIKSFLHFSVPDEGPLTDYESWMPDFIGGLARGIENSRGLLRKAMTDASSELVLSPQIPRLAFAQSVPNSTGNDSAGMVKALKDALSGMSPNSGDIVIPVYLGGSLLDEVIVSAQQRANLRSGGR